MTPNRRIVIWACFAFLTIAGPILAAPARAAPNEPDGYTEHVAKLLAAEAPDLTIAVRGRLTLSIKARDGDEDMQASLDRVWEFCRRNQRACDDATTTFVRNSAALIKEQLRPLDRTMLRVVVRPGDYAEQVRRAFMSAPNAKADAEPAMMLFVSDLWLVCVADLPSSVRVMNRGDLEKLGLSVDEAIALGRQNVRASLRPLKTAAGPLSPQGYAYIEDHEYESSRILLHADWAELAKTMTGDLIVAVLGDRLTVYGDSGRPQSAPAMAAFARYAYDRMERPISVSLFRWTPRGWEPVTKP